MTMSLYINLTLLAVLLVIPVNQGQTRIQMVVFVLMTTLALLIAHQIAFRLSSRFMNAGVMHARFRAYCLPRPWVLRLLQRSR
jgi:predicted membrane channel-forming protein YqfA (hemolysin III family)